MATEVGRAVARTSDGAVITVLFSFDGVNHVRQGDPDVGDWPVVGYNDEGIAFDANGSLLERDSGTQQWVNGIPVDGGVSAVVATVEGGTPGRVAGTVEFHLTSGTTLPIPVTIVAGRVNDMTANQIRLGTRHSLIPGGIRGPIDFSSFSLRTES